MSIFCESARGVEGEFPVSWKVAGKLMWDNPGDHTDIVSMCSHRRPREPRLLVKLWEEEYRRRYGDNLTVAQYDKIAELSRLRSA